MPPSIRARSMRELNPDLFVASRRRRARDAAARASAALSRFLGSLLRRQGQDWRALCDELRRKEAAARREADDLARELRTKDRALRLADERARVAEAGLRHADGERDEALRELAYQKQRASEGAVAEQIIRRHERAPAAPPPIGSVWRDRDGRRIRVIAWLCDNKGEVVAVRVVDSDGKLLNCTSAYFANCTEEPGADLLHPTGRCTCCGEGTCAWCIGAIPEEPADPDPRQGKPGPGADLLDAAADLGVTLTPQVLDFGRAFEALAQRGPCPGPKEGIEPIDPAGPAAFAASATVAEGDDE